MRIDMTPKSRRRWPLSGDY